MSEDTSWERFTVRVAREDDGRWFAEVPELHGVLKYGDTEEEALIAVLRFAADVIEDEAEETRKLDEQEEAPSTVGGKGEP